MAIPRLRGSKDKDTAYLIMARRNLSTNRPDTLTQTFHHPQSFPCSRAADHTCGNECMACPVVPAWAVGVLAPSELTTTSQPSLPSVSNFVLITKQSPRHTGGCFTFDRCNFYKLIKPFGGSCTIVCPSHTGWILAAYRRCEFWLRDHLPTAHVTMAQPGQAAWVVA